MMIYLFFAIIAAVMLLLLLWPARAHKVFCAVGAIVFFSTSFGMYAHFGSPDILPLLAQREEKLAQLKTTINSNSEAVKTNPKNIQAWVELGDAFMETSQFPAAANAYKQSVLLSRGNPILIMAYAQALIASADGKVTDEAKKSIDMALLLQPENPQARYFTALRQLQTGDTEKAMKNMKELYRSLPDDSPVKSMINRQIGRE